MDTIFMISENSKAFDTYVLSNKAFKWHYSD